MKNYLTICQHLFFLLLLQAAPVFGQESVVLDTNGDGLVTVLAFGDSLTYGVGDGIAPGSFIEVVPQTIGGYPARIEELYGINVLNRGVPGEELAKGGIERIVSLVSSSNADLVVFLEGTNDSIYRVDRGEYARLVQKAINVCQSLGKSVLLATLQNPCCNHAGREPFTASYSDVIRELGFVNNLRVADLQRAWETTCQNQAKCELYNLPEGLHPNTRGYDVMGQTILAALLGIDIFASDGASQLADVLGLPVQTIIVKPAQVAS